MDGSESTENFNSCGNGNNYCSSGKVGSSIYVYAYCEHVVIAKIPFAVPDDPLEVGRHGRGREQEEREEGEPVGRRAAPGGPG